MHFTSKEHVHKPFKTTLLSDFCFENLLMENFTALFLESEASYYYKCNCEVDHVTLMQHINQETGFMRI